MYLHVTGSYMTLPWCFPAFSHNILSDYPLLSQHTPFSTESSFCTAFMHYVFFSPLNIMYFKVLKITFNDRGIKLFFTLEIL